MDSPAQSLELPTTALTDSTDARKALHGIKQMKSEDLKHTAQQLSDYGVHLLAPDEIADQLPLYSKPLSPCSGKSAADGDQSRSMKLKYR